MALFKRDHEPAAGLQRRIAAKNMKDRLVVWGKQQLGEEPGVRAAGKAAGKRAGSPPRT